MAFSLCAVFSCANSPNQRNTSGGGDADKAQGEGLPPDLAPNSKEKPKGEDYAESRPDVKDRTVLTVAMPKARVELDFRKSYLASEAELYTALYEGLFSYHPLTMEPVAALAESWEVSEDKKNWTFNIRPEARYCNGDPLRAEDFRAAWLSNLEPERQSPYASFFDVIDGAKDYRLGKKAGTDSIGIEVKGEKTLVVRLNAPAPFFPALLCHHSFGPVHSSMLEEKDWSAFPPVSNGAFYVFENTAKALVFKKNDLYWDSANVELQEIIIRWTENSAEAAFLWNSGEARWISGDIDMKIIHDRTGLALNPIFATHYYYIRSVNKPWNDYLIRRALTLVLPWDEIRAGQYLPAKTLVYPISGYPEIEGLDKTDIPLAKKILKDAGYPGGKGLPTLIFRISPGEESERIGSLMSRAWEKELGIKVKLDVIPFDLYFDSLKEDNYDVGFSTWIGDFADPYTFLALWRRDSNLNDARFNDNDYELLLDRSMSEDGEARYKTLSEAEELLLQRGTVIPISYSYAVNVVDRAELEGWFLNVLDLHPFKYIAYRKKAPLPGVVLAPRFKR